MSKRANPFTDDFLPQSKIHVGPKQFNNNHDRLKTVYKKTLELLFNGARKIPTSDSFNNNDLNFKTKDDKMKQLFIGKDGSLLHTGTIIPQHNIDTKCSKCGNSVESQCAYCELSLCGSCLHACQRCHNTYCQHCVITGWEEPEVCVSCYG